jgi:HD-like signal output (HDOD) protein
LLLAANLPEKYSQVLARTEGKINSIQDVEIEVIGASHAELGASVLGTWGLPVSILEAIAWHHAPEKAEEWVFSPLTAVHVANAVEEEKRLHKAGNFIRQIQSDYIEGLGLSDRCKSWRETCGLPVPIEDAKPPNS